jgi:tape measure domain-containing protein
MAEQTKLRVLIDVVGEQQLGKLRQTLTQVESSTGKLGNTFAKARVELKRQEQATKASINSTRAFRDSFRELANSVEFGSAKFKIATREAERLDKQLAKMEKRKPAGGGMRGAAQIAGTVAGAGVFGGVEGALGAGIGAIAGGPAGAVVGGAIGAQVGQLRQALGATAEYAAELSKLRIALRGVTIDQVEYDRALGIVKDSTQDFAIPQSVLTRQFTKLQASVKGAGGSLEDTRLAFRGVVAAVRATGGSLNDIDAALTATAQVFSKGRVSAEELRQQLGERLPGAFTLFAESMNKTPAELDKALELGKVSLQDFQQFAELLFEKYGETSKIIASGPDSAGDRLKVSLEELNEEVGKLLKPIGEAFQTAFGGIVENITKAVKKVNEFTRSLQQMQLSLYRRQRAGAVAGSPEAIFTDQMIAELGTQLGLGGFIGPELPERFRTSNLPGIDPDTPPTGGAGGASARQDLTAGQLEARRALRAATEAEAIIRLEYESRVLDIKQRQLEPLQKIDALEQAKETRDKKLEQLQQRRAQALEKERLELQKAMDAAAKGMKDSFDAMYLSTAAVAEGEEAKGPFAFIVKGAQELADEIKNIGSAAQEVAKVGLKGLGDALTELVVNGTLNFREFAASLLRDMARIIMQTIVVKSLMQAIGALGPTVSPMPNMTGAEMFKGPRYDLGFVPAMAKGGITQGLSIAGEAGPEAVVPLPDGRSIPVTMQGGAGNVVVNVDAKGTSVQGDSTRSNALGDAIGAAVRSELLKQRRPGGLLA